MLLTVVDACVLIDLVNGGLMGCWFQLGIETHTTDAVLYELENETQRTEVKRFVDAGLIKVSSMYEGASFEALLNLANTATAMRVSAPDASSFLLAKKLGAILVTGDGTLRREAGARGVTVCGVLWILDSLIFKDVISFDQAGDSLRLMLESGARLPTGECDRRFQAWNERRKVRPREV